MAKKVKTITEEEQIVESAPVEEPVEVVEEPRDEDLDSFLTSYADEEPQIKVYKYNSIGKSEFCSEASREVATEHWIQSKWGEGKYPVILFKGGRYLASKNIWIGKSADVPVEVVKDGPAPAPGGNDMMMQLVLGELNANRQMMAAMIGKIGNGNKQSSFFELAQAMEMLKTVVTRTPRAVTRRDDHCNGRNTETGN